MEYEIAIPSYKRESVLNENTLKYLNDVGINSDRINVFVANKSEEERYKEVLKEEYYNEIIVGKLGIGNQRTFIRNYYDIGTKLVMLDDDLEYFVRLDRINKASKLEKFDKLVKMSYKLMKKYKTGVMGINGNSNAMYLSNSYNYGLYFLIGLCTFELNNRISSMLEASEDYETSLKSFEKYGGVLRWNNVSAINNSRKKRLGMVSAVNTEVNFVTKEKLLKRYPKLIKKSIRKYNSFEISMVKQNVNKRVKVRNDIFE